MIDTVVSVKLPIGEMLRIKRNRLMPDVVTGEEKRICLESTEMSLADSISAERSFAGSRQNLRI